MVTNRYDRLYDAQYLVEMTLSDGTDTHYRFEYTQQEPNPHDLVPDGLTLVEYAVTPLDGTGMFW